MQRCVELLTRGIATLSEAYIATQLDLAEQRQRAADELLSDFTLGVINEATMTRAHAAGLRPAPAHQALVVAVTDFDVWRRVANGLGRLGCLCGEFGGTGVVLAPVPSLGASELVVDDLAAALGPDATVAAGPEGRGATGIKASLEEAGEILALARVLGRRGVVTGEEMRVPMLLHTAPDQAARFVRLLAPILEAGNRGRPLLETLRAYVATGGSIQGAAEVLFTHRNTVRARLARIEALLGWPLEGRRLELELGLVAYDLGITP